MWIFLIIIGIIILYNLFSNSSKSSSRSTYYSQTKYPSATSLQKPILPTKKVFSSKIKLPDNLVITEEFDRAFDLMENTKKSAYITGKAGTGKSTLLTYFRKRTKKM
jgi:ATP-dependent DNA helicase PIF1